jgi:hypothetical protein
MMLGRVKEFLARTWKTLRGLPPPVFALAVVGVFAAIIVSAVWGYRTWDYVEHDNEFCMGCHLMQEPYEQFAESAHRGLGCKACHQPTLLERSSMGVTAVLFNPDEISVHAAVPNERCIDCHVEGDPDQWNLIARSRGHRVHLESEDPVLEGLMCVECHATSVHQFASLDETCAQSDCHTDSKVQLGEMSELMIHCAACHAFNAPLEAISAEAPLEPTPEGELLGVLSPAAGECLSCHAMRTLVEMPDDEPHDQVCGTCHNPHEQETPADAVQSCAVAGCHDEPADSNAFHVGIEPEVYENCSECHTAHDFHAEGQDCLACHTDIFDDRRAALGPPPASTTTGLGIGVTALHVAGATAVHAAPAAQDTAFFHGEHRDVECASCHAVEPSHGALTVTTVTDCRQCHHTAPVANPCATCHADSGVDGQVFQRTGTFTLTVVDEVYERSLPFDHAPHAEVDCADCHAQGPALAAVEVDCASCHEEHHELSTSCMSCHAPSPQDAHTVETHVGCGGSGCHTEVPFDGVPRERELCLVCHQDQTDHEVQDTCAECHALPEPGSVPG